jgi:hypothetical protein
MRTRADPPTGLPDLRVTAACRRLGARHANWTLIAAAFDSASLRRLLPLP